MGLLDDTPAPDAAKAKDSPEDKGKVADDNQVPDWLKAANDENLHKNPTLRRYKSLDEALVGHVALKSKLGENPIAMPSEKDPPEKWNEFWETHFKVPKDPDGYRESLKFPEKHSDEVDKSFLMEAKKLNLFPGQVQGLYDWLDKFGGDHEKNLADQKKKEKENNIAEMTKRHGHELKNNEQVAEIVLTKFWPAGTIDKFKANGAIYDPDIFDGLVKIGKEFLDGDLKGLGGTASSGGSKKSKAELEQMIKDSRYCGIDQYGNSVNKDPVYIETVHKEFERSFPGVQQE